MFRKPIKIADINQSLPEVFRSLRANEAIIWMENHHLKYKLAGDETIYDASGITLIDTKGNKFPVTPETILKLTGSHIKSTEITKSGNTISLDISLNLSGEALLDIIPAASDTHFGVIKLSSQTEGINKRVSASEWLANYSRITVEEHVTIKNVHNAKPSTPVIGDAYHDTTSNASMLYNKFTQPVRFVGIYSPGETKVALIGSTTYFESFVSDKSVNFSNDTYGYNLTKTTESNPKTFLKDHGISDEYEEIVTFWNIPGGLKKSHDDDDLIFITAWDKSLVSVKSIIDCRADIAKNKTDLEKSISDTKTDLEKQIDDAKKEFEKTQELFHALLQQIVNVQRWQDLSKPNDTYVIDVDTAAAELIQKISEESNWQSL